MRLNQATILAVLLQICFAADSKKPVCTAAMFNNDTNALWACRTLDALQNNWFPSPIAGLFSYLDWNGFDGFWQNGVVLQPIVDFMKYTNTTRYNNVLQDSWRPLDKLVNAYYGPSCDDEMWFGISFANIYDQTGNKSFLDTSRQIFNWTWELCWDTTLTCNGGLFFGGGHGRKITIINAQGLILAAKLYRLTNDTSYLNKSLKVLHYLTATQVLNMTSFLVSDSLDVITCEPNMRQNYTYDSGVIIGGLVELYRGTHNSSYLQLADKIATANVWYNSIHGIFTEYCDLNNECEKDYDALLFKGIFMSNLRYLLEYTDPSRTSFYQSWIQLNIDHIIDNAMCQKKNISKCPIHFIDGKPKTNITGPIWNENWHGPFTYGGPQQQTSALSLLIAGIKSTTTCQGEVCNYNPEVPVIKKLTCSPNPCPPKQACCEQDNGSGRWYTCCETTQYCMAGNCYDNI